MAEIAQHTRNRPGVAKSKKLSTRVDLTPMVDLGFLLITFFIFTTTMAQPNALNLIVPDDSETGTTTPATKTLSLILDKNNEIYYYHGFLPSQLNKTTYNPTGVRHVIDSTMVAIRQQFGSRTQTIILIKPTAQSSYKNVVDVLDEMIINGVTKYVLMDADVAETDMVKKS